jgi:ribosomal protein S15P/S13E
MTILSNTHSQTLDSILISRVDALKVLGKAKEAELLQEKLTQKEKDIASLTERIDGLKQIISVMQDKDNLNKSVVQSYEKQIKELQDIRKLQELDVMLYKKQIRKLKRGKFWTAIAGTAATVGAFWLGTQL